MFALPNLVLRIGVGKVYGRRYLCRGQAELKCRLCAVGKLREKERGQGGQKETSRSSGHTPVAAVGIKRLFWLQTLFKGEQILKGERSRSYQLEICNGRVSAIWNTRIEFFRDVLI